MNFLLIFVALLGLVLAEERIGIHYHGNVGIPLAARIKRAEESIDFNGGRIVGGTPSVLGEHPYVGGLIITLTTGQRSVCSCALLSNTRLITAAHCWWDGRLLGMQFEVVLGSKTLFSGGTRIITTNVFAHQSYNTATLNNDIAMLGVPWITYTINILPISLPYGELVDENYAGWWVEASGYGRNNDTSGITTSQFLSSVDLQVITNAQCAGTYGSAIVSTMMCTSGDGVVGTCGGDSGGPVAYNVGGHRVLVGVVSFGSSRGCELGFPNGHSRVTSFLAWILARL